MAGHSDQGFAESENASFLQPAVEWGTKPVSSFLEMAAEPVLGGPASKPSNAADS